MQDVDQRSHNSK